MHYFFALWNVNKYVLKVLEKTIKLLFNKKNLKNHFSYWSKWVLPLKFWMTIYHHLNIFQQFCSRLIFCLQANFQIIYFDQNCPVFSESLIYKEFSRDNSMWWRDGDYTQNLNESLIALNWKIAPKEIYSGPDTVQVTAYLGKIKVT